MYQLLALLTGVLLSVMISINGSLSGFYDMYTAAVIIHAVGVLFALVMALIRKEKPLPRSRSPWWFYLGGVIGVATTLFNVFAFGRISMTSIVALGLLGQTVTSVLVDSTGWMGMVRRPFKKSSLIGLVFCLAGIVIMLDNSVLEAALAVWFSLLTGVVIVISRSINARLAERIGAMPGSFVNHLAGLPVTIIIAFFASPAFRGFSFSGGHPFWAYLGGILGVFGVVLFNILVPKISQFSLTVLTFAGQVASGIVLDLASGQFKADRSFIGGLVITGGIGLNMLVDYLVPRRAGTASSSNRVSE